MDVIIKWGFYGMEKANFSNWEAITAAVKCVQKEYDDMDIGGEFDVEVRNEE